MKLNIGVSFYEAGILCYLLVIIFESLGLGQIWRVPTAATCGRVQSTEGKVFMPISIQQVATCQHARFVSPTHRGRNSHVR